MFWLHNVTNFYLPHILPLCVLKHKISQRLHVKPTLISPAYQLATNVALASVSILPQYAVSASGPESETKPLPQCAWPILTNSLKLKPAAWFNTRSLVYTILLNQAQSYQACPNSADLPAEYFCKYDHRLAGLETTDKTRFLISSPFFISGRMFFSDFFH